jgi:hypothetical protein
MPGDAAADSAQYGVVARVMAGDRARGPAGDASDRAGWRGSEDGNGGEAQGDRRGG